MKFKIISIIFLSFNFVVSRGILADKENIDIIKKGLDHAYNYEFKAAESHFDKIKKKYPSSPAYYLCEAIKLNLEHPEIVADGSELFMKFNRHIKTAIKLSDSLLKKNHADFEGIFFKMNALSLLGLKYSQAKQYSKAMNIAKDTYEYVKKAIDLKDKFYEFYFTSGLYNYYVVQYPESHPIIKPFMIFFQNGNKKEGLSDLEFASKNSVFSNAEATFFLSNINFKYEYNFEKAFIYISLLNGKYPKNNFFQYKLGELAIMKKDLKIIKTCLDSLKKNNSIFYRATHSILDGGYNELIGDKIDISKKLCLEGISILKKNKINANELLSIAYLVLARCYAKEKNALEAKNYYKLTMDNSSNKYYEKEAIEYLKRN